MRSRTLCLAISVLFVLPLVSTARAAELCIVDSAANGRNGTVDCSMIPQIWDNEWTGYNTTGVPCSSPGGASAPCILRGGSNGYGWTISSSSTNPHQNSGPLGDGKVSLYLWLACSSSDGMSAVEFDLAGTLNVLDFVPLNGFLSAGTPTELLLAVGGCPSAPVVAGEIIIEGPTPVEVSTWGSIKASHREQFRGR